jgi:hypothetical protein
MQPSPRRVPIRGIRPLALGLSALAALSFGWACAEAPLYADWHVWVDEERGIALDLPPTHAVGATDHAWYVHGWIDGEPMVPDMSVQFLPDVGLDEAIRQAFEPDALVEHVTVGSGLPARRVTARYRTPDGVPYVSSGYVVPAAVGAFVIRRWEGFDWRWFDHVALTFRWVGSSADVGGGSVDMERAP